MENSQAETKLSNTSPGQNRLVKIKSVSATEKEDNSCSIRVELFWQEKEFFGERSGPNEQDYKIMLSALCTLDALHKLTEEKVKMELLFVERQLLEKINREVIMVLIDITTEDISCAATGACQLKNDVTETAVRAVLDATNRMVELSLNS
ncbi:MAG: hypothetical protein HY819_12820 [Acidobacteria bacterium]|nr:hypothetical protein [Acidobacteriota bacterium]